MLAGAVPVPLDGLEDKLEDRLAKTRLAKPYDTVEDALEAIRTALTRSSPNRE